MATASGTFDHIVGAAFDEVSRPIYEASGVPEEHIRKQRQIYIRDVASNPNAIAEIEQMFGVKII